MKFVSAGLLMFFVLVFVGSLLIAFNAYRQHRVCKSKELKEGPLLIELRPLPRISEHV